MGKKHDLDLGLTRLTVPPGTHTCLLYQNEDEKREFYLQFLIAGIRRNEKVICISDSLTKDEILSWFCGDELDLCGYELEEGVVVRTTQSMYYPHGYFSPEEMIQKWRRLVEEARLEGFTMLRATGEITWLASQIPGVERFVEYEMMVNELLKEYQITVVCQFDINRLHGATLMEIISVHPLLIVKGQLMHNPFFYSTDAKKGLVVDTGETEQISSLLLAVSGILATLPTSERKAEFTEGLLRIILSDVDYHLCLKGYISPFAISGSCLECTAAIQGEDYNLFSCPLTDSPDLESYEIRTADFFFGYLLLPREAVESKQILTVLVLNYLNHLALSLENSIQKERLHTLNQKLIAEILVKEEQEELIRKNEERIKAIMEGTDEGLWEWDLSTGTIVYDENWQRILGYEPDEISFDFQWLMQNIYPGHRTLLVQAFTDYTEGVKKYYEAEYKIRTKAGEWRWIWTRGISLESDRKGRPLKLTGTNRDITVYRETQEALQASVEELAAEKNRAEILKIQKLESLGLLAGGIAHDFNNLLAAILSNVQLVSFKLEKGLDGSKDLKAVEKAALKASNLTKQLLAFSRGGAPVKHTALLSEIITETVEFALGGSAVKCEYNLSPQLWVVEVDGGQISQVIQNLIINACQAMPEGGIIKVSAYNQEVAAGNEMMLSPGNYVKVEIEDQGVGIPEEDLTRIFDPYFTTKKQGNGLGLSTCYYIMKNHDGYIGVRSKVGAGSTFYLYFPAASDDRVQCRKEDLPLTEGNGRILMMEDEPLIRNSVREFLENCGYQVSVAEDGSAAIALYKEGKESSAPFDVVIMDLTIPGGMGGKEAIKHILAFDPQAKVIVSSGYFNDPVMSDYQRYGFCNMVTKPYKMEELSEKIKESMTLPEALEKSRRR